LVAGLPYGIPALVVGLTILVLTIIIEILFSEKKNYSFWESALVKLDSLFTSSLVIINLLNIRWIVEHVDFKKYFPIIIQWIGYIGITALCMLLILGVLKLNQMILNLRVKRSK
jgi:hypothetical protein